MNQDELLYYLQIINTIVQSASLIFLIIYVWKTWQMATSTRKASEVSEQTVIEMREARMQDAAPYLVTYFDIPPRTHILYLVLKNIGKGTALDVRLMLDPPLQSSDPSLIQKLAMLNESVAVMPPGYEIRAAIDFTPNYFGNKDLPIRYSAKLTYFGSLQKSPYVIDQLLDLNAFRGILWDSRHDVHDLTEAVKQLVDTQRKSQQSVDDIAERLKQGVLISNPSIISANSEADRSNWKEELLSKLKEFSLLWAMLESHNASDVFIDYEPLKPLLNLYSGQFLVILANSPDDTDNTFMSSVIDIAKRLRTMGTMSFYMDGGESINKFHSIGESIVKDIIQLKETGNTITSTNK